MTPSNKIKTTELRIQILREKIVEQASTFDMMNNKMFALVGLLLTLGGLLSYDIFKISNPNTSLEVIIFVASLISLGISAVLIGMDYRARRSWSVPIGPVEEEKLDSAADYQTALTVIHDDYRICYSRRDKALESKAKYLNGSFHLFVIGVILLIVLKIGG